MVVLNVFGGTSYSALIATIFLLIAVIGFCYKALQVLRGPMGNVLSVRANKYKLIFLMISINIVFNNIFRQIFPYNYDIREILTAIGVISSIFFIITIFYLSEEHNSNKHPDDFEHFKKNKKN